MWVGTQSSVSEKQTRSTFPRRPAPVEPMGLRDPENLLFLQCAQPEWMRSVETNISCYCLLSTHVRVRVRYPPHTGNIWCVSRMCPSCKMCICPGSDVTHLKLFVLKHISQKSPLHLRYYSRPCEGRGDNMLAIMLCGRTWGSRQLQLRSTWFFCFCFFKMAVLRASDHLNPLRCSHNVMLFIISPLQSGKQPPAKEGIPFSPRLMCYFTIQVYLKWTPNNYVKF